VRKWIVLLVATVSALGVISISADESRQLPFPTTEDEIVDALRLKDGRTEYRGVVYERHVGKVYKVINGRRYRLRGLNVITDADIVPKVGARINFQFNSAAIHPDAFRLLDEFGKALTNGLVDASIIIAGHADEKGSHAYNQKISEKRAQAVKNYLHERHQIDPLRMTVKGFGETRPIASNQTDEGRALNRRVEFIRMD
jgi:outer membrane protein OmpA-like peptidoglycan-associated protein